MYTSAYPESVDSSIVPGFCSADEIIVRNAALVKQHLHTGKLTIRMDYEQMDRTSITSILTVTKMNGVYTYIIMFI